jgi:hypothetical protein
VRRCAVDDRDVLSVIGGREGWGKVVLGKGWEGGRRVLHSIKVCAERIIKTHHTLTQIHTHAHPTQNPRRTSRRTALHAKSGLSGLLISAPSAHLPLSLLSSSSKHQSTHGTLANK